VIRARDVELAGVHRKYIRALLDDGTLEQISRGTYRLADAELAEHTSLVEVAVQVPQGVICLLSALAFHGLTTQSPSEVWIAIAPGTWRPASRVNRLRVVRMSRTWLDEGVEVVNIDGIEVKVTSPVRTVVDCFRFRSSVGLDVALEALRECLSQRLATPADIMELARRRRVASVMRPYVESLVA
jgi:predicted transcriptional regulator of viral defense system